MNDEQNIKDYLEKTGQSRQELYAGSQAYGVGFIIQELIPRALKENKKIVWKDLPEKGIGAMSYSFQDL